MLFLSFLRAPRPALALAAAVLLAGCASVSPDGLRGDVGALAHSTLPAPGADSTAAVAALLAAQPLDADAAVRIALLRNPGLEASLATLGVSDAERVQAGRLPNPHLSMGRFTEGSTREIERLLSVDVLSLVTLPWRMRWQGQQVELSKLAAAQDVVRLAADTRRAWIRAVAAQQVATQMQRAHDAAEAGAQLARRMAQAGNFSRLQQAREDALLADAAQQLARARQASVAAGEQLHRLMGLDATQRGYTLPERLPPLPASDALEGSPQARTQALRERLDVRAAQLEAGYVADSLGYTRATGFIDALELGYGRNTSRDGATGDKEIKRGWEIGVPIPLFDWGQVRNARARGVYLQSAARVRDVALRAQSEVHEADAARRTAHALAHRAQHEGVAVQQLIQEETLLRYNGMLASVWELLAQARATSLAVGRAIDAERDFWLADTDWQQVLTGTSPGALASIGLSPTTTTPATQGH